MSPRVAGIILAAGNSSRMGSPKALLEYEGQKFIHRLKSVLGEFCDPLIVVGSSQSQFPIDAVNPKPERGMLSSLQCGLRTVPQQTDAVLFTLVDLPAIDPATVRTLIDGWRGEPLRVPRFEGRRGHPVMLSAKLIADFLNATGTPKDIISAHAAEIVYVDVDDPGVVTDVDTPDDYRNLSSTIAAGRR